MTCNQNYKVFEWCE